jgi:Gpi18-like mannosyltransferase
VGEGAEANDGTGASGGAALWLPVLIFAGLSAWLWQYQGIDVDMYLIPWLDHVVARGPAGAFSEPFSNYSPPYLYLLAAASPLVPLAGKLFTLKLVSLLGTLWLAAAAHGLFAAAGVRAPLRAAALLMLLPTVLLNGALLAQCDAMWTAACVSALACALQRRVPAMLVWCGIAIAFKAQAVFFAPFVLAFLIAERAPWRLWLIPPLVFTAAMLPAWLAGWPAYDLATIYFRQAQWSEDLSMNAPNIWAIVQHFPVVEAMPGAVPLAIAALAALAYMLWVARRSHSREELITAALLSALLLPGLLPRMHERYFFLADVLAFALAFAARDRAARLIAAAVQTGSFLALWGYMTTNGLCAALASLTMMAATVAVAARLVGTAPEAVPRPLPA